MVTNPQPTIVQAPIHLRIADDIRMQIERGDLAPGDPLPTLAQLCDRWSCSMNSARGAVALLKAQGLINAGRGRAPIVRVPPARVIRSSEGHQVAKDLALRPEDERGAIGEAEATLGMSIHDQDFNATYNTITDSELADLFGIASNAPIMRRQFQAADPRTRHLLSSSTSYIPRTLIESNPDLLNPNNEPWPGGGQHQFLTVGIEIMSIIDHVTARMPTTVEAQQWNLADGVPLLTSRQIAFDRDDRPVDVSDATYPADRTEFRFTTRLRPWTTEAGDQPS